MPRLLIGHLPGFVFPPKIPVLRPSKTDYGEEQEQQKNTHHRDFYNVRKVDNHIHHAAAMNVKHLTRFMKKKFKKCVDDIVGEQVEYVLVEEDTEENEEPSSSKQSCHTVSKKVKKTQQISLGDLARELNINWSSLTINSLQMWTDRSCMHRFDRFNSKYSPLGQAKLRTLFLKTDNIMNGQYFAEITRELLDDLEETKYQHTEWRLSLRRGSTQLPRHCSGGGGSCSSSGSHGVV